MEQPRALHEVARVGEIGVKAALDRTQWDTLVQVPFMLKPFKDATVHTVQPHWALSSTH